MAHHDGVELSAFVPLELDQESSGEPEWRWGGGSFSRKSLQLTATNAPDSHVPGSFASDRFTLARRWIESRPHVELQVPDGTNVEVFRVGNTTVMLDGRFGRIAVDNCASFWLRLRGENPYRIHRVTVNGVVALNTYTAAPITMEAFDVRLMSGAVEKSPAQANGSFISTDRVSQISLDLSDVKMLVKNGLDLGGFRFHGHVSLDIAARAECVWASGHAEHEPDANSLVVTATGAVERLYLSGEMRITNRGDVERAWLSTPGLSGFPGHHTVGTCRVRPPDGAADLEAFDSSVLTEFVARYEQLLAQNPAMQLGGHGPHSLPL